MRKNILGALIASAFALGGTAHAGLIIDLNGALPGGQINASALDWAQTSFLARGGTTAIGNFVGAATAGATCAQASVNCSFEVLTHARLGNYTDSVTGGTPGLPAGFGEITMVARYTETVIGFIAPTSFNPLTTAFFASTGVGSVEFYYSSADSVDLTGTGFDNGRLIGRLDGLAPGSIGSFTVTGGPVSLDQFPANDYTGVSGNQQTVTGFGSQASIFAGTTSIALDPTFFLTPLASFSISYTNISIALPFLSVNPSDCFNDPIAGRTVGTGGYLSTCDAAHVNGLYSAQLPGPGYLPVLGPVNGLNSQFAQVGPDFVAQTDYNSAVTGGTVPEPGSLALMGLALGSLAFVAARRRRS